MIRQHKKDWLSELEDKFYWVEVLSGWLMALCFFGGFFLMYRYNQSPYGFNVLKISFIFLFIMLFYKIIIYAYLYVDMKIKVKKGILVLKDPVKDAVHDYLNKKS